MASVKPPTLHMSTRAKLTIPPSMYGRNCHLLANSSPMAKGTSVMRLRASYAAGVSSRIGSSRKSSVPDGIRWQNEAASATLSLWWYSIPRTGALPTASRIFTIHSAVMAIDSRGSKRVGSPPVSGTPKVNLIEGQPSATSRFASSTASGPMAACEVVKQGTQSRCAPPRSWYTGTSRLLATTSYSARSIAEMAAVSTRPPSKYWLRYISCQSAPILRGSFPTRNSR